MTLLSKLSLRTLMKIGALTFVFSANANQLSVNDFFSEENFAANSTAQFKEQRELFVQADKKSWRIKSAEYQEILDKLEGYPLKPYFEQRRLSHNIFLSHQELIEAFLDEYGDLPIADAIRKKWLYYLVKRNRQSLFLKAYRPTRDVKLQCWSMRYQLNAGADESEILPKVTKLWVVGKSQPKECDPLFKRWQQAGLRTDDVVWQRLSLAATSGQHTLVPYLTSLLPEKDRYLGKLFHKVRRDPSQVTKLSQFPNKDSRELEILAYGFKRFIWRDQNRTLRSYQNAQSKFAFTQAQQQQITLKFALALASKKHAKADHWLQMVDDSLLSDHVIQWRVADALRQFDWAKIKQEIESLPIEKAQKNNWRYWLARSLAEEDQVEDAKAIYTDLATKRHYYGFLAAGKLNQASQLQDQPLAFTLEERAQVMEHSAAKRAFELFYLQRYTSARREWGLWLRQLDDRQKLVAAKLANEISWFDRAIFTLASVGYLNDVNLRFPIAYGEEFEYYAAKNQIKPAWALAISRRESSFMTDANSSAGALGLMQIMPRTAKQVNKSKVSKYQLFKADKNISIGTKYLSYLLDRHQGNQVLATAAYNAGPYRIDSWLKKSKQMPADVWIETIPFKETREYVKSVLAYQEIYHAQLGQEQQVFNEVLETEIKR